MKRIAVLILTYNEEKNIEACIQSVLFADEIIVIDSGSKDNTLKIAEDMGAKTVIHAMTEGFAAQRNFALTQTQADWVLFLDADERITPQLSAEIQQVIQLPPFAYEILRRNVVFGQPVAHGGHSPDYSLRLYPRDAITWQGIVHEKALVTLPVKRLKQPMLHYTYTSWDRYFFKFDQYTTMMASRTQASGKRIRFHHVVFRPAFAFFRDFILKRGFLDGKMGFILAGMHAFYTMIKYVKLYLLQREERGKS
jgi:glycosyltransferase involved in cell wall biosynthesis